MGRSVQLSWPGGRGVLLSLCMLTLINSVVGVDKKPGSDKKTGPVDKASKSCDTFGLVPGLPTLTRGLDISTFDLLPTKFPYDQKLKHPLFDFTCNENKFWAFGSVYFDLPDQIASVITIPGGTATLQTSLSKTTDQVREHMNIDAGVSGGLADFSFSASASYTSSVETIVQNERYTQDVSSFTSAARAEFLPTPQLHTFINKKAQGLISLMTNKSYAEDRSVYDKFISKYGTHFISSAHFGGVLKLHMETKSSYLSSKSDTDIKAEAEAAYGELVSAKLGMSSVTNTFSDEFSSSTKKNIEYLGGDTNILQKDGWQQWQPSVFYKPWLIKTHLVPISDMFKDEKKRENMEMAVEQHVLRSFLLSLKRKLTMLKVRYSSQAGYFETITKRLNEQERKTFLSADVMRTLGDDRILKMN